MEMGGQLHTLATIDSSNGPTRGSFLPFSPQKTDTASCLNIVFRFDVILTVHRR